MSPNSVALSFTIEKDFLKTEISLSVSDCMKIFRFFWPLKFVLHIAYAARYLLLSTTDLFQDLGQISSTRTSGVTKITVWEGLSLSGMYVICPKLIASWAG